MTEQKPATTVGYVDARIFGKSIRFEIARDPVAFGRLEEACGSFSAMWKRFQRGEHSTLDVRTILATAFPYVEPPVSREIASMALTMQLLRGEPEPEPGAPLDGAPYRVIDTLMQRVPFGGWEELAALIMAAAINGIEQDRAVFEYPRSEPEKTEE